MLGCVFFLAKLFLSLLLGFLCGQFVNRLDFSALTNRFFIQKGDLLHYLFKTKYLVGNIILTLCLFLILINHFSPLILLFCLILTCYAISVIDLKVCLVPDTLQIILLILSTLYAMYIRGFPFLYSVSISMGIFLFFCILYVLADYFKKENFIGFADIKLFGSTTLCIDWQYLSLFFFGVGSCGILFYLLCGRRKCFPFAPSIVLNLLFFILLKNSILFNIFNF